MSHISAQGEQSTSAEILVLENLAALGASASGEFIRKTSLSAFENATPAGGSGISIETPSGLVNSSNVTYTVIAEPKWIVADGITYFDGVGYTYAALTLTMTSPPGLYIRSIY